MQLEIAGNVLAGHRIVSGIHHQLVKGAAGERVHALMSASGALFHQNIVAALLDHAGDQMIDEPRIQERRVGANPHHDIGVQHFGGAGEAGQHVVFRAAHNGDAGECVSRGAEAGGGFSVEGAGREARAGDRGD